MTRLIDPDEVKRRNVNSSEPFTIDRNRYSVTVYRVYKEIPFTAKEIESGKIWPREQTLGYEWHVRNLTTNEEEVCGTYLCEAHSRDSTAVYYAKELWTEFAKERRTDRRKQAKEVTQLRA